MESKYQAEAAGIPPSVVLRTFNDFYVQQQYLISMVPEKSKIETMLKRRELVVDIVGYEAELKRLHVQRKLERRFFLVDEFKKLSEEHQEGRLRSLLRSADEARNEAKSNHDENVRKVKAKISQLCAQRRTEAETEINSQCGKVQRDIMVKKGENVKQLEEISDETLRNQERQKIDEFYQKKFDSLEVAKSEALRNARTDIEENENKMMKTNMEKIDQIYNESLKSYDEQLTEKTAQIKKNSEELVETIAAKIMGLSLNKTQDKLAELDTKIAEIAEQKNEVLAMRLSITGVAI
ncbi:MAG: hypothetical protein P4M11_10790 [Candidatus Pacebacteria bacterium]|nr:hypothetical protein [Candidatus Paceibacterota bacterium]